MKRLYVFADFDWLKEPRLIGELSYESLRGSDSYGFCYNDEYHTLLSRRFDRHEDGRRIHFASAMTLLGLNDGDNANTNNGYLDIVDFILQHCTNVEDNLEELYRRVAFNICIGNTDDHFRNHGFLLTAKGWTLSPAYDMNPTLNEYQSLLINNYTNKSDLNELLNSCEEYMLSKQTALQIIGSPYCNQRLAFSGYSVRHRQT